MQALYTLFDDNQAVMEGLYPLDASHTRLVWRIHNAAYNWASPYVGIQLFTDAVDFFAVRQNMLGIQARAEGVAPISQAVLNTEAALWAVMFLGLLVAGIGLVVRRDWLRPLLAVSATGLLLVGLVLIRSPVWVDGLVTLGICVGLWWIYRPAARRASVREITGKSREMEDTSQVVHTMMYCFEGR